MEFKWIYFYVIILLSLSNILRLLFFLSHFIKVL